MRYFTTTTDQPVIRLTPYGLQLERVPVKRWYAQHDDGSLHLLAPMRPIIGWCRCTLS